MPLQKPRVLRVETGHLSFKLNGNSHWTGVLDYDIYQNYPAFLRKIEKFLRMDLALAVRTRKLAREYDLIWAMSEKVAVPLTLMGVSKPLVVITHHLSSRHKAPWVKRLGIARKWTGIGYHTKADKEFIRDYFDIPEERLFECVSVDLQKFRPAESPGTGGIFALGVSKRDYPTLVEALRPAPARPANILVASRYGDVYRKADLGAIPPWVNFRHNRIDSKALIEQFHAASFSVLPLLDTTQFSAGLSAALEASACGKAVIATHTAGMPTCIQDGVTGILVPPNDPPALRAAIEKLWNQPELAEMMGKAGRR